MSGGFKCSVGLPHGVWVGLQCVKFVVSLTIYAKWNFPPVSKGRIQFEFIIQGCWIVNFMFIQILKVHYVSKLFRTWSDAASDPGQYCLPISHKKDS